MLCWWLSRRVESGRGQAFMSTLNLGILAHIDAGKTSLTERLLFDAGVIRKLGRVDDGNTQTDSLALERQRGITIKTAVASFVHEGVTINLIDTPGHPDFIAEVERVLSVLDGVVLVLSAVEGVQAQTLVLMRTLKRMAIPTLIFVNKIDRVGAQYDTLLDNISAKLTPNILAMGTLEDAGTRVAAFLPFDRNNKGFNERRIDLISQCDDDFLAAWLEDEGQAGGADLDEALAVQTRQAAIVPVFFGSARTGIGTPDLMSGVLRFLPTDAGSDAEPVSGTVFKIERVSSGQKKAYVRLFSGRLGVRDKVSIAGKEQRVTSIQVFENGAVKSSASLQTGQIGILGGLDAARIGDTVGAARAGRSVPSFSPPILESVIVPGLGVDKTGLHQALSQLAEQDPLINLRQDDEFRQVSVSLYGEVQKEVIQDTLATQFGFEVDFQKTTTICIERLAGSGNAVREMRGWPATLGLLVEPALSGEGILFDPGKTRGSLPLSFFHAVEETVSKTLEQGLYGWQVPDCKVTMTHTGYNPGTVAGDFRKQTRVVLMRALADAGTTVCEPVHAFHLEFPADLVGAVLSLLSEAQVLPSVPIRKGAIAILEGKIPAGEINEFQKHLPSNTRGEGWFESSFDSYEPVRGEAPTRPGVDRDKYLGAEESGKD